MSINKKNKLSIMDRKLGSKLVALAGCIEGLICAALIVYTATIVCDEETISKLYMIAFIAALVMVVLCMAFMFYQVVDVEGKMIRQNGDLRIMANTDALTGLVTRRAIEENYEHVMKKSKAYSILMGDIDDFKKVNDTYGHNTGDLVLREIANIFKESVREHDLACRWGGEEILVFLTDCSLHGAKHTADRIRERISNLELTSENGAKFKVSMTMGVADSLSGSELVDVIHVADLRLYDGKKNGKNVVVADDELRDSRLETESSGGDNNGE